MSWFVGLTTILTSTAAAQVAVSPPREQLRQRVEMAAGTGDISVGDERIHAESALARFYERRAYELAWSTGEAVSPNVALLLEAIRASEAEGMRPGDYHVSRIERTVQRIRGAVGDREVEAALRVDLDLLCTDAFLLQAAHRLSGRVDPETIDREWIANRRSQDLVPVLESALQHRTIGSALADRLPPQPAYVRLREHLQRYRGFAADGGWESVSGGPNLERAVQSPRVRALQRRLSAEGYDVSVSDTTAPRFDESLDRAVRTFQARHGLDADGIVGPATLRALNVPADVRARQIALNMERWRWLPQDLGQRHVIVNIAGFWLEVIESREVVLDMRVIVGRSYRRTPVFSKSISYLVFNPYWNVPTSIATKDILPEIKRDPSYLARHNMKLFSGWGADARIFDPGSVDWSRVTDTNFPYRIRQEPGPNNALGMVKFMFPNAFNVYLHDTPAKELFSRVVRTFSSGCIRVEKPVELAAYLLRDHAEWTAEKIKSMYGGTTEQTVQLTTPIPVHLLYWTAWVTDAGHVAFAEDFYGRDLTLENALQKDPPAPTLP